MLVSQKRIDEYISKWNGASRSELKDRLKTLKNKANTADRVAEEKAIIALLA